MESNSSRRKNPPDPTPIRCYRCEGENGNHDMCTDWYNSEVCDPSIYDTCLSIIKWRRKLAGNSSSGLLPPPPGTDLWLPGNRREYEIHKSCSRKDSCMKLQNQLTSSCVRNFYMDWTCVECCNTPECNYWLDVSDLKLNGYANEF